jgi:molecular chaperone IbpA
MNTFFNKEFSKYLIGFDTTAQRLAELADHSLKTSNWPPYNIKKIDENKYVIEMAVAGFAKQDIEIELADNKLLIKGKSETLDQMTEGTTPQTSYLYRGIADRAFTRQFTLADNVEIKGANLLNGMLRVWLESFIPETQKPQKVEIEDTEYTPPKKKQK